MEEPLEISFRNVDHSSALEAAIRERAEGLERFFDRIVGCRVVVEAKQRRHHKGNLYALRIDLHLPGHEIVVNRTGPKQHAHEDVYVALRDAFNAAARQLEDHARKVRGDVKTHEAPLHGRVLQLFPEDGYGFVETADGREIYFHKNSVVGEGFDALEVGREVRLVIAYGESAKGPQASTVTPSGKHHIVE